MSIPVAYIDGLLGGMLIGLAAVLLFLFNGRIMGVSGITASLLGKFTTGSWWRVFFIAGLILGGWIYQSKYPVEVFIDASWETIVVAGALVGLGTVIGGGCTSGHGICGIARLSKRSIVATIIFMTAGILTVLVKKALGT